MFNPHALVYLHRNWLLTAGKRSGSTRFDIPETFVKNLEIIQPEQFAKACRQFFEDNKLHGKRVLVVLDPSVVFDKTIALDQSGQPDLLIQGFIDAIPFEAGRRASISVQTGSSLRLFATNPELYTSIADALHAAGVSKVVAVSPAAAYDLANDERTVSAATERFFANTALSRQANFLSTQPV